MTYFSQLSRGCLAEYFLARSAKLKGLAGSSGISAVFGITEPAIFGVNLRLRWPFYVGMGAASIGAMLVAIFDVKAMALGAAGFIGVGELRAPLDGKVAVTFPSGHAYAIRGTGKDGKPVDVLMHIGFDTVNLKGEHFTPHVKKGDEVRAGDLLATFDIDAIVAAGDEVTTPVVVSNSKRLGAITPALALPAKLAFGEPCFNVEPKPAPEPAEQTAGVQKE